MLDHAFDSVDRGIQLTHQSPKKVSKAAHVHLGALVPPPGLPVSLYQEALEIAPHKCTPLSVPERPGHILRRPLGDLAKHTGNIVGCVPVRPKCGGNCELWAFEKLPGIICDAEVCEVPREDRDHALL